MGESADGMPRERERIEERPGHTKLRERRPSAEPQAEGVCDGPSRRKTQRFLTHAVLVLGATLPRVGGWYLLLVPFKLSEVL